MKKYKWNLLVIMIIVAGAFAFAACKDDNGNDESKLKPEEIQKQWFCDLAETPINPTEDLYNHIVTAYEFFADGTGYFEFYDLLDDSLVMALSTRNFDGFFTYTIKGNIITIDYNKEGTNRLNLIYKDGLLTDYFPRTYAPSTPEQKAKLLKWCQEWDERVGKDSWTVDR